MRKSKIKAGCKTSTSKNVATSKFNPADPMVRSDALKIIQKSKKNGITLEILASKQKMFNAKAGF